MEIKANKTQWWPLEPQVDEDHLPHRGYLPIAESKIYESDANAGLNELAELAKYLTNSFKGWNEKVIIFKAQ